LKNDVEWTYKSTG